MALLLNMPVPRKKHYNEHMKHQTVMVSKFSMVPHVKYGGLYCKDTEPLCVA